MSRFRLILVAAISAAAVLAVAGSASASYSTARDSGWIRIMPYGAVNSDCFVRAALVHDATYGNVYGTGNAVCNNAKRSITVQTVLKRAGAIVAAPYRTNATGGWVSTAAFFAACDSWQTVAKVWVTDANGYSSYNYVTTGSPVKWLDHCAW